MMMGFGTFGCDVVRNTRRAVTVMPGVLAMLRKAGPIKMRLGGRSSASTTWQALQASRAKECPAAISPSCAYALRVVAARAATRVVRRMYCGIRSSLGVKVKGSATPVHPRRCAFDPHERAPRHRIAAHLDDAVFGPGVLKAQLLVDRFETTA